MQLNTSLSSHSLYYQVYNIIFQEIINNTYKLGDKLPSEPQFMEKYNVSRATIRQAISILAQDGLVQKKSGIGTIVVRNTPLGSLAKVVNYEKKFKDKQITRKKLINAKLLQNNAEISSLMQIDGNAEIVEISRVRYSKDIPCYIEYSYYDKQLGSSLLKHDLSKLSLRKILKQELGCKLIKASQKIYASVANDVYAKLLNIPKGNPILVIERISYDDSNTIKEYVKFIHNATIFYLEIELAE